MSLVTQIRGWLSRMFSKKQIEERLHIKSAQSQTLTNLIQEWTSIYHNAPKWKRSDNFVTLNVWALVCKRLATRMCINLLCETDNEIVNAALAEILPELTGKVEAGAAKGGLIIKPIPQLDRSFKADFVTAEDYIITGITSGSDIYGIIFISRKKSGDMYYTKLEIHNRDINTGKYMIQNRAFQSKTEGELDSEINLNAVDEWASLEPIVEASGVMIPLFGYFKAAIHNNVDGSPIGIAFPHRAIQLCEEADKQYNRFIYENKASKKKTIVPLTWLKSPRDGQKVDIEEELSDLYTGMNMPLNTEVKEFNPEIRNDEFLKALNEHLRQIESVLDLSRGTLSRAEHAIRTATEIETSDDVGRTTISSNQEALEKCVREYCNAVAYYAGVSEYEFTWKPDDGIIDDEEKKFARWLTLADSGYIPKYKVVMLEMGASEEEAKKMIADAKKEMERSTDDIPVDVTLE